MATGCNQPDWVIFYNHTRLGATSSVERSTLPECLDYCVIENLQCEGVDIDYNSDPVRCWSHTNPADYVDDSNLYSQPGTHTYQLITRCANVTTACQ